MRSCSSEVQQCGGQAVMSQPTTEQIAPARQTRPLGEP